MTKASDNAFPSILITEGTEPSAPAAGKQRLYIDSTSHHLMRTNSSGTETDLEAASGGTYSAFTPTLTADGGNPNLGSTGSATGRYTQFGKMVHAYGTIVFGGTGVAAGSGAYEIAYPVAPATGSDGIVGTAILFDSSATFRGVAAVYSLDTGEFRFVLGNGTATGLVTNSVPWTWAADDFIRFGLTYEAA